MLFSKTAEISRNLLCKYASLSNFLSENLYCYKALLPKEECYKKYLNVEESIWTIRPCSH